MDGMMINTKRSTQEILQEEMLRERAAVLARAGERLSQAMEKLHTLERDIEAAMTAEQAGEVVNEAGWSGASKTESVQAGGTEDRRGFLQRLNAKIHAYNLQREQVRIRYYYLSVTREAMGMIHHQRLEEMYRIPPKKRLLPEKGKFPRRGEAQEGSST